MVAAGRQRALAAAGCGAILATQPTVAVRVLWGWFFDGTRPDKPDMIGGAIALLGVLVMMYWPRAG